MKRINDLENILHKRFENIEQLEKFLKEYFRTELKLYKFEENIGFIGDNHLTVVLANYDIDIWYIKDNENKLYITEVCWNENGETTNMETEIKDYNLMYADNNEDIIGYVADMIKYFKAYSKELIEKMEDKTELDMCYEFIEELEELECKDTTLIKAYYNPMGKYEYTMILDY